jgi:hypothetical protein
MFRGDQLKQFSILPAGRKEKKKQRAVKNGFHTLNHLAIEVVELI